MLQHAPKRAKPSPGVGPFLALPIDQPFRVPISGNVMAPDYADGQLVEFEFLAGGVKDAEPGEVYLFVRGGGHSLFQHLIGRDAESVELIALNQEEFPGSVSIPAKDIVRVAKPIFLLMPSPTGPVKGGN